MNEWVGRVKERMKLLGISREDLAQKMGLTYGAITHYLTGRRVPPLGQFHRLAELLKTDAAWLHYGEQDRLNESYDMNDKSRYSIPIVTHAEAAKLSDKLSDMQLGESEFIPDFFSDHSHWIALRVQGDAMSAPLGNLKTFIEGSIIVIDNKKKVADGSFVVAVLPGSQEVTFKQYVIDSGVAYLKPLNPQYPMVRLDNDAQIRGVVIWCLNQFY
jgi:SOS-response transcriptional repressor LexA